MRPVSGPAGTGDWPLAFDQERLWQLHRENPALISWNVDAGSHVRGELDLPAFLAAFHELIRRHAAWRATFPVVDGRPVQRVHAFLAPETALIDVSALPAERRERAGHRAIYDHTRNPFDLERGPLLRMALVRLAAREHLYLLTIHHLVTDWITFQIFSAELMAVYAALRAGRPSPLPPLPVQYPDYVLWEREWLQGEVLAAEADFWRRELAGFPLVLDLPGDRPRPAVQSQRGGLYRVRVGSGAERPPARPRPARGRDDLHGRAGRALRPALALHRPGEAGDRLEQRQPRPLGALPGRRLLPHPGPLRHRPGGRSDLPASCSRAAAGRRCRPTPTRASRSAS